MRLSVTAGDRQVELAVKGNSAKLLRRLERTATRLLALETPKPEKAAPFGFCVSDTELADP